MTARELTAIWSQMRTVGAKAGALSARLTGSVLRWAPLLLAAMAAACNNGGGGGPGY